MSWMVVVAVLAAGTLSTFTDWLFMGVLFHDRYDRYPEVWWPQFREKGDTKAIIYSSLIGYLTAAAIVALCLAVGITSIEGGLVVAVLAWLAGPLVSAVTTGIWMKIDPLVTLAHSIGYLARFLIAGIAAALAITLS